MSQVRWIKHEEEQEEQLQPLQMPCPTPAPWYSHLSCACSNQLLNLKQPESSFETAAKPLGYVCARRGREHIPTLPFSFSCSPENSSSKRCVSSWSGIGIPQSAKGPLEPLTASLDGQAGRHLLTQHTQNSHPSHSRLQLCTV